VTEAATALLACFGSLNEQAVVLALTGVRHVCARNRGREMSRVRVTRCLSWWVLFYDVNDVKNLNLAHHPSRLSNQ